DAVDGRADIYSLGMLLYVALGGRAPKTCDKPPPPLSYRNRSVSVGLSDIIYKCLSHDPRDRYPDAASLASDLRRPLANRPPRGVPNRSWAEGWRKWRSRPPMARSRRGLILLVLSAVIGAPAATLGIAYLYRVREIDAALDHGRACLDRHQAAE